MVRSSSPSVAATGFFWGVRHEDAPPHHASRLPFRHLPVVSGDRLLSKLSIRDLMLIAIEERGAYLKEYLYQAPPSVAR
jgi:hypothetical protein